MGEKIKSGVIAGVLLLVAVWVTMFVPLGFVKLCCCLWALGGGALAAYLYSRKPGARVGLGDGALMGAVAGAVAGLPFIAVLPVMSRLAGEQFQEEFARRVREMGQDPSALPLGLFAMFLIAGAMFAFLIITLSAVGGVIGASLFGKGGGAVHPSDPPPPPPPDFGGPAGGFGQGG